MIPLPFLAPPARRPVARVAQTGGGGGGGGGGGAGLPPDIVRPSFSVRNPVIKFIGRGEAATRIVTFAQPMPKGWFPSGATACLRTSGVTAGGVASGTQIRTQIDIHHRYDDGSARLLLLAAEVPQLNNNEALSCSLEIGASHPSPGSALDWSTAATGKSVSATMGSATIDALANVGTGFWRQGPLVLERRCQMDTVSGGPNQAIRFVCDISLYKDGGVAADTQFCNDVAFSTGTVGAWTGACTLSINGTQRYNSGSVEHLGYTRLLRWLSTYATRMPVAYPDMTVIRDAGLFPSYDFGVTPSSTLVTTLSTPRSSDPTAWNAPYGSRSIQKSMGATGGRLDIGYMPGWVTANIVSGGSVLLHDICDENAEAAGAPPWHSWHRATNSPVIMADTLNDKWWDYRDTTWSPPNNVWGTWSLDTAHQPSCFPGPFLWGGRRAHLDGMMAQAAYGIASLWPASLARGNSNRVLDGSWCNLFRQNQLRGGAWTFREVMLAWWGLPETGPGANAAFKSYLNDVMVSTTTWIVARTAVWSADHGAYAGFFREVVYNDSVFAPWQNDYAVSVLTRAWLLGNDDMGKFLGWMADGWMGHRAETNGGVWNPRDGFAYLVPYRNTSRTSPTVISYDAPMNTWANAGDAIQNGMWQLQSGSVNWVVYGNGTGATWLSTSGGNYAILGSQSFVDFMRIFPTRTYLRTQFDWLQGSGAPYLTKAYMENNEIMSNVMPPGETRA